MRFKKKALIVIVFVFAFFITSAYSFFSELVDAFSRDDYEQCRQLIEEYQQQYQLQPTVKFWIVIQMAIYYNKPEMLKLLAILICPYGILQLAFLHGGMDTIKTLLHYGASPREKSSDGSLSIHAAAQLGSVASVSYIYNMAPDTINSVSSSGYTPLSGLFKLLEDGEEGIIARLPIIYYLLTHGANPNCVIPDQHGDSLLHEAVSRNLYAVVIALIANNVAASPLNDINQTPLQMIGQYSDHNSGMVSILGPAVAAGTSSLDSDRKRMPRTAFSLQNWAAYWIRRYFSYIQINNSPLPVHLICFVLYHEYASGQ